MCREEILDSLDSATYLNFYNIAMSALAKLTDAEVVEVLSKNGVPEELLGCLRNKN